MALWDGRAVKEYQKPWFRPRPWGSITTGWSWQPSDPPFQKMTHIQTLQTPVTFWALQNTGLLFAPYSWFITIYVRMLTGLLPFLFFYKSWTGCCTTFWYWIDLTDYVFTSLQAWDISNRSSSENKRSLAEKKSKLPQAQLQSQWPGQAISIPKENTFFYFSLVVNQSIYRLN